MVDHRESDLGPARAADPVALHRFDGLGPVQIFEVIEQAVGVVGDFEEPLLERLLLDQITAAPTPAGFDLFVGQDGFVDRAPPLQALVLVSQSFFEEEQE